MYFVTDGHTYTLPHATTAGQQIIVVATTASTSNWILTCQSGETFYSSTGNSVVGNSQSFNFGTSGILFVSLISTGSGKWLVLATL